LPVAFYQLEVHSHQAPIPCISVSLLTDDSLTRPEILIFKDAANPAEYHAFNNLYGEVDMAQLTDSLWKVYHILQEQLLYQSFYLVIVLLLMGQCITTG